MKRTTKYFVGNIFLLFLIVAFTPASSQAQERSWTGATNSLWSESGNWDAGGVPSAGQYVIINLSGASVTYDHDYPTSSQLFGLQLDNGSSLSHGTGTTTPTLTLSGPLLLGYTAGKTGTYNLSNGALSLTDTTQYGIAVGYDGTGIFNQTGGTNTVNYGMSVGRNQGSHGTYTLSGGTLSVGTSGMSVGRDGTGIFNLSGGTHTIAGGMAIGREPTGVGTYNLSATGTLSAQSVIIGRDGTGTFNQTGGTERPSTISRGV